MPATALPATTVAAVLLPGERLRVDAAGNGCFAVVHRDSVPDADEALIKQVQLRIGLHGDETALRFLRAEP